MKPIKVERRPPGWAVERAIERRQMREKDGRQLRELAERAEAMRRAEVERGDGGAPF